MLHCRGWDLAICWVSALLTLLEGWHPPPPQVHGPGGVEGPRGCMVPGGAWSRGMHGPGEWVHGPGGWVHGPGGLVSQHALRQIPLPGEREGYCCGRYASYWNAFLFCDICFREFIKSNNKLHIRKF